jgi:predicted tellurium resistance membrane protein TerC
MDIVFSVDSVLASLAISSNPVIVLIGGLIGILAMRGIAEVIMKMMQKIPELETMAYVLIGIIALKLLLSIPMIDIEIPSIVFAGIVILAFLITIGIHYAKRPAKKQ